MLMNKSRNVKEVIIYRGIPYKDKEDAMKFAADEIEMVNEGRNETNHLMLGEYIPIITYDTIQFCIRKKKGADTKNIDSMNKIKELYDNRIARDITAIRIIFDDDSFELINTSRKTVYYLPLEDENGALFNCDKADDVFFRGVFDRNGRGLII